jgi:hypothetical protein
MSTTDRAVRFLNGWRDLTRALEGALVDNLAATSPWLAPLIPAYLGFRNMTGVLGFPPWVGIVGAIVIETLGLSTVHTVFTLWDYNDSRRKSDQRAPMWAALIVAVMYVLIILTVNVLLDYDSEPVEKVAMALLSSLSVVAAITLAVRANHARRVSDIQAEREERRELRQLMRADAAHPALDAPNAKRIHPQLKPPSSYTCELCGESFASQPKLAAHMRWQHPKHPDNNGHKQIDPTADEWIETIKM